jgi:hypothetical protein
MIISPYISAGFHAQPECPEKEVAPQSGMTVSRVPDGLLRFIEKSYKNAQ